MSEGARSPRGRPKLSTGLKTGTSASQEPKPGASEGARGESSRGAARTKRSTSQPAAASDQSVQNAQEALSALQLSIPFRTTIPGSGYAATSPSESVASTASGPRAGQERSSRQGGPDIPPGLCLPRMPSNESSRSPRTDPTVKGRLASQSGRGGAPRAVEAAGSSSSRTLPGALGTGSAPRAVEAVGPSSSPTLREALARGSAPHAVGAGGSSSSQKSSEALGRGTTSSSSGRLGPSSGAAPLTSSGPAAAVCSDTEGRASQVSRARPLALYNYPYNHQHQHVPAKFSILITQRG